MRRNSGQRNHNREENKKLANLVNQLPQLYDRDHVLYGKINAVEKAWKKIGKMWQKPVPECKRRWRNIRAAYARSIDAYKTKHGRKQVLDYYLAKEMKFLEPHLPKQVAAIDTARDEPILTERASEAAQNNGQNNENNNSEAGAYENDVHDMNNTHTNETFSLVMPLIDKMDEQSLRDLKQIIERKLEQIVDVENNNENELSAFMQPPLVVTIKEEPELWL